MNDIDDDLPGMLALQNRVEAGEWPHTMDAQVWARKWLEITKEVPEVATDEDAMIGWFANAIMAGYDTAMMRSAKASHIAELESHPADQFTAELVEIDGHTYGLRPGAARVVKEAMRDAQMLDFMIKTSASIGQVCGAGHWVLNFWPTGEIEKVVRAGTPKEALDIAMAKDGAR